MKDRREDRESGRLEFSVEINAPVEAVWKALTEAEELTSWFPLDARVKPGKDGSIWLSWGPGMEGEARIEVWEPGQRFRWVEDHGGGARVVIEFTLETRGGKTVVRLVDSGFGLGADWKDYYDSKRCGWDFELRSLRHYLENHRGKRRRAVWARRKIAVARAEAWRRLWSSEGLLREGRLGSVRAGERYRITAATGDRFEGSVHTFYPEWQFGGSVENMNNALLRVEIEPSGSGQAMAYVWLSSFGLPEKGVEAFRKRWERKLALLFPEGSGAKSGT